MADRSDLVGQILCFCMPIEVLDQKSILSEIHVRNTQSFHAVEEVALGSINAVILNLLYLLSSSCIVHIVICLMQHLPACALIVWGGEQFGFYPQKC